MKCSSEIKSILKIIYQHFNKGWKRRNSRYTRYQRCFKVKKKTILYESFYGRGMLDNPYALFCAIMRHSQFKDYRHIWVLDSLESHKDLIEQYRTVPNVSFVEFQSKKYLKALATVGVLINNSTFYSYFSKRPEQIYINTWHGIPLKKMANDEEEGRFVSSNMIRNFLQTDYLISANEFLTEIYKNAFRMEGIYEGKIVEAGYPRLDLLVHAKREQVLANLERQGVNLDKNKKIILYAPTWRGESFHCLNIDLKQYVQFKEYLEAQIDTAQYQILVKVHQAVYQEAKGEIHKYDWMVPAELDANLVLSITDVLISDYSSIYFDFLATGRPLLFYIPDVEAYEDQRGFYFPLEELPGPYTESMEQLATWLNHLDEISKVTKEQYQRVRDWCCDYPIGEISDRIVDAILGSGKKILMKEVRREKKKIVFFVDKIRTNGILNALINFMDVLDYQRFDVTLCFGKPENAQERELISRVNEQVRFIIRDSSCNMSVGDAIKMERFHATGIEAGKKQKAPFYLYQEEVRRLFGDAKFDYSLDYCGYSIMFAMLTQAIPGAVKGIWLHNDMASEREVRMPWLGKIFSLYPLFDKLISCSYAVMMQNKEKLGNPETLGKFTYCKNAVNESRVKEGIRESRKLEVDGELYAFQWEAQRIVRDVKMVPLTVPGIKKEPLRFITIGRLSPEKNHAALIQAFARFVQEGHHAMLFIVGGGALHSKLDYLIRRSKMQHHIILTGLISNPSMLLKQCDCFILPSLHEGQPIVLHEARAAKMPIIMSRFSSYESAVVENGQYLIGMSEEEILEGLHAWVDGMVPNAYEYESLQNNAEVYREFLLAIGES